MSSADALVLATVVAAVLVAAATFGGPYLVSRREREAQKAERKERLREAAILVRATSLSAVDELTRVIEMVTDQSTTAATRLIRSRPEYDHFATAFRNYRGILPKQISELSEQLFSRITGLWSRINEASHRRDILYGAAKEEYLHDARMQLEKERDDISILRKQLKELLLSIIDTAKPD